MYLMVFYYNLINIIYEFLKNLKYLKKNHLFSSQFKIIYLNLNHPRIKYDFLIP
jgi:hypothetical protein